ncbi:C10 family peptidase [Cecembia lonarensis]|uniref:Peptidase C10 family protein n=1 Tax=Cecembia lonarensis (strain CCUG 58316 / KCTC 22772 / LW9) TaxID=1225176 RepID=K1LEH1_CECL9|nr:C10 family peptidase [Cecembia lonarensis]EKB48733.1 Peptidase C10 family protein [Cecembia lonarensis LW9]
MKIITTPPPPPRKYLDILSGYFTKQVFGLLCLITFSCQEFEPIELAADLEKNDIHYIDIEKARIIATTIEFPLHTSEKQSQLKSTKVNFDVEIFGNKNVKESKSPLGKGDKALYHIINYEEGGFIIISADDRLVPVLAFSFDNEIPLSAEDDLPEGLIDWFSTQEEIIELIRDNPDAEINLEGVGSPSSSINLWDPCAIQRQVATENMSLTDPCDPGGGCEDQFTQVGPLMNTTWGESCGYNQFMPLIQCSPQLCSGRAYSGSTSVAYGQIMKYHSHPNFYNYNNMLPNTGTIETATMMSDILNAFPAQHRLITCFATHVSQEANFPIVLTNTFNYSSAQKGSFNSITVRNNLNQNRPVILFGTGAFGRMWVTDGYQRTVFCETGTTHLKLHMNWGWDGDGNGFFNFDNWSVTIDGITYSFNNNTFMIFNIIP